MFGIAVVAAFLHSQEPPESAATAPNVTPPAPLRALGGESVNHVSKRKERFTYTSRMRKRDESDKRFFRTPDRLFRVNDEWWFATREKDQGPFSSKEEAELALRRYCETMENLVEVQKVKAEQEEQRKASKPDPKVWNNQFDVL